METVSFTLSSDVNVAVTVTELEDGSLQFDLVVLDDTGSIGDLNGLFFDLVDDSVLSGMSVEGDDVTGVAMKVDGVTKVSGFNNINGETANDYGKFDIGIEFGTSGIGENDIRETSFVLSHDTLDLTLETILGQDFATRLTSVGTEDGSRDDSLKIGGTAPTEPDDPGTSDPVNLAVADSLTVDEFEIFNFAGPDTLDSGAISILENDLTDSSPYLGVVTSVNGIEAFEADVLVGSNGGLLIVSPDGSIDFSANLEFSYLVDGESAQTSFSYGIEGGSTAVIDVTILGSNDDGGGGGGGGDFPPFEDVLL